MSPRQRYTRRYIYIYTNHNTSPQHIPTLIGRRSGLIFHYVTTTSPRPYCVTVLPTTSGDCSFHRPLLLSSGTNTILRDRWPVRVRDLGSCGFAASGPVTTEDLRCSGQPVRVMSSIDGPPGDLLSARWPAVEVLHDTSREVRLTGQS